MEAGEGLTLTANRYTPTSGPRQAAECDKSGDKDVPDGEINICAVISHVIKAELRQLDVPLQHTKSILDESLLHVRIVKCFKQLSTFQKH